MPPLSNLLWTEGERIIPDKLSHPEELLLTAALADPEEASRCWLKFTSKYDLEAIYPNAVSLLPMIYQHVHEGAFDSSYLGKLKGLYRRTWVTNQLLMTDLTGLLNRLEGAGMKTLLTDSCSLSLRYYANFGLRSMENFHIAVPYEHLSAALEQAKEAGFQQYQRDEHGRMSIIRPFLIHGYNPSLDELTWQDGSVFELRGSQTRLLGPEDQLVSWLVRHDSPFTAPPLWVADVITVASCKSMDWEKVFHRVRMLSLTDRVISALTYLEEMGNCSLIPQALQHLKSRLVSDRPLIAAKVQSQQSPLQRIQDACSRLLQFTASRR